MKGTHLLSFYLILDRSNASPLIGEERRRRRKGALEGGGAGGGDYDTVMQIFTLFTSSGGSKKHKIL